MASLFLILLRLVHIFSSMLIASSIIIQAIFGISSDIESASDDYTSTAFYRGKGYKSMTNIAGLVMIFSGLGLMAQMKEWLKKEYSGSQN